MPEYLVSWEIDIEADSPKEAAQKAWNIMRRSDSTANCFDVYGPDGWYSFHDLAYPEESVVICEPRNNQGPYTHVEVGFPSEREELLMPYAEDQEHPTETVYGWVPRSVIEAVILKHNGGCAIKELTFNVEVKK